MVAMLWREASGLLSIYIEICQGEQYKVGHDGKCVDSLIKDFGFNSQERKKILLGDFYPLQKSSSNWAELIGLLIIGSG